MPQSETASMAPMVPLLNARGFDTRQEVKLLGYDRVIDLVAANPEVVLAFEGARHLDERHVEQCRTLVGICNGVYLVLRRPVEDVTPLAERGIGLWISGDKDWTLAPIPDPLAQPHILRASFNAATDGPVEAGSPSRSCNNAEAAWLARFKAELPMDVRRVCRFCGHSPWGGPAATRTYIRKHLHALGVVEVGGWFDHAPTGASHGHV